MCMRFLIATWAAGRRVDFRDVCISEWSVCVCIRGKVRCDGANWGIGWDSICGR